MRDGEHVGEERQWACICSWFTHTYTRINTSIYKVLSFPQLFKALELLMCVCVCVCSHIHTYIHTKTHARTHTHTLVWHVHETLRLWKIFKRLYFKKQIFKRLYYLQTALLSSNGFITQTHGSIRMPTYTYKHTHTHTHTRDARSFLCVCVCVYMYTHTHTHERRTRGTLLLMYARTHLHTYIHVWRGSRTQVLPTVCLSIPLKAALLEPGAPSPGANISVSNVQVCIYACIAACIHMSNIGVRNSKAACFQVEPIKQSNEEPYATCFACIRIWKRFLKPRIQ